MKRKERGGHFDVAIIGAGLSGMAAAIRLAHFGRKVCVFERHELPGGLNSFYLRDGRRYDVGLHAMTNFARPGARLSPMVKLLRQLRISRDELDLCEQLGSRIVFPGVTLSFNNEFALLETEIAREFPRQIDGFRRLTADLRGFNEVALDAPATSAREALERYISDPVLRDMILCPLMYYGSARPNDMDFYQFAIMFKSIFMEGFARPKDGALKIVQVLFKKFRQSGAQRRMRCGVRRLHVDGRRIVAIELDDGDVVTADRVFSSMGSLETRALWADEAISDDHPAAGRISFVETMRVLSRQPSELGWKETIVFFNDSERFAYDVPEALVDTRSGVICFPNNFDYGGRVMKEGWFRVTCLANFKGWTSLPDEDYRCAKAEWFSKIARSAQRFLPPVAESELDRCTVATDMFTPRTIKKFTGRLNGAVYGALDKVKDGRTELENLFLCGTDQGFLGIVGAMLSGISMANLHGLSSAAKPVAG